MVLFQQQDRTVNKDLPLYHLKQYRWSVHAGAEFLIIICVEGEAAHKIVCNDDAMFKVIKIFTLIK